MDNRLLCVVVVLAVASCVNSQVQLNVGLAAKPVALPVVQVKPLIQISPPKSPVVVKSVAPANSRSVDRDFRSADRDNSEPFVKPYFGRCDKRGQGFWGHHHHNHKHGGHHYGYLLYHFLMHHMQAHYTNAEIVQIIKSFQTEESTENLINLMTVLTSPEAKKVLQYFNVKPADAQTVLNQLKSGNEVEINKAKTTIHNIAKALNLDRCSNADWYYIRYLAEIYYDYLMRVKSIEVVRTDSIEKLVAGLTALAAVDNKYNSFPGIDFKALLNILNTQGEAGRPQVVAQLTAWIPKVDIRTLHVAGWIYGQATENVTTTTSTSTSTSTTSTTTTSTTTTSTTTTSTTTPPPTELP